MTERIQDILPGCHMIQGYGLTESTCIVTVTHRDDNMFGSVGHVLPGNQVRLVDADGNPVGEGGGPGELQVRGPSVVPGYMGNEAATREMRTADGWLRTGDLIEFREGPGGHKQLFVIDRIKELIKVRVSLRRPASAYTVCCESTNTALFF